MKGKCYYCNKEFSKLGILRHIRNCSEREKSSKNVVNKLILSIEDKYNSNYWLYIGIDKDLKLEDLDKFLRDIWVECCGHLSCFKINGHKYYSKINLDGIIHKCEDNMNIKLENIVKLKDSIEYEYDIGITTYLNIKVVEEMKFSKSENSIILIARNNVAQKLCSECNNVAEYYDYENQEYLCSDCLKKTFRDKTKIEKLRYENSPRDHICDYHGDKYNELEYLPKALNEDCGQEDLKWININENFTLDEYLDILNKKELTCIAKNLHIKGVASLKKEDLKNKILSVYNIEINNSIENIDMERYKFLINVNKSLYEDDIDKILYFRNRGILFNGIIDKEKVLIIPKEIKNIINSKNLGNLKKAFNRNKEIIELFWGMCFYYGVISIENFKKLLKGYVKYSISNIDLENILKDAAEYYKDFNFENNIGSYKSVKDVKHILESQEKSAGLKFYHLNKQQLLNAAKVNFIDKNKYYKTLVDYLINMLNLSKDKVEKLINTLEICMKNDEEFDKIVLKIIGKFKLKDVKEAADITNKISWFSNSIRLWTLNGHTLEEINS